MKSLEITSVLRLLMLAFGCMLVTATRADLLGVDVSTHQGFVNWNSMKSAGVDFGFIKATEGVDFIDNRFVQNMNGARDAGVPIGPYHYARPDSAVGSISDPVKADAVNEANDFVDLIKPYYDDWPSDYLRPVLDVEELPATAAINTVSEQRTYLSAWIRDFNDVVQDRLGVDVILYTNGNYANNYLTSDIAELDLWFAKPTGSPFSSPPTASNLGIWDDWAFWQYSWTGNLGGESPLDLNTFEGTEGDLQAFFFDGVSVPDPPVGDFNGDGVVDAVDFTVWRDAFPSFGPGHPADANGNNFIDVGDWQSWADNYGAVASPPVAVPEPGALLLLSVAAMASRVRQAQRR